VTYNRTQTSQTEMETAFGLENYAAEYDQFSCTFLAFILVIFAAVVFVLSSWWWWWWSANISQRCVLPHDWCTCNT